jgi:hypothetical protein
VLIRVKCENIFPPPFLYRNAAMAPSDRNGRCNMKFPAISFIAPINRNRGNEVPHAAVVPLTANPAAMPRLISLKEIKMAKTMKIESRAILIRYRHPSTIAAGAPDGEHTQAGISRVSAQPL